MDTLRIAMAVVFFVLFAAGMFGSTVFNWYVDRAVAKYEKENP